MPIVEKFNPNICNDLYDWVQSKYSINVVKTMDENGEETTEGENTVSYIINLSDDSEDNLGVVSLSFANEDGKKSVVVSYQHDIMVDEHQQLIKKLNRFTKNLKDWASAHVIGFEIRDISIKPGLRGDGKLTESKFSPWSGTVRTSVQALPNSKLVIKHSENVDPETRGARSRKIHKIYVENQQGERFLLPERSLRIARAHARHVNEGGNPYDSVGQCISNLGEEALQLAKFVRKTSNRTFESTTAADMTTAAQQRLAEVRDILRKLGGERGYKEIVETLDNNAIVEWDQNVKSHFASYDKQIESALPWVYGAYQKMRKLQEIREFEAWVAEAQEAPLKTDSPDLDPLKKALGLDKQTTAPITVGKDAAGKSVIQVDTKNPDAQKKVAGAMASGRLPKGTSITTIEEDAPTQFKVYFKKPNGKKVSKTFSAASQESAELEAYNIADSRGWAIVGDISPVTLGGDSQDVIIADIASDVPSNFDDLREMEDLRRLSGIKR